MIHFDGSNRVLSVDTATEELIATLFGCKPQAGESLPPAIHSCILRLKELAGPGVPADRAPLVLHQPDGSSVKMHLKLDFERNSHCLTFERQPSFSDPEQLRPLGLTDRETGVAYWVLQGKTNVEIARMFSISSRTVDKHVERIFRKVGVHSRRLLLPRARELCDSSSLPTETASLTSSLPADAAPAPRDIASPLPRDTVSLSGTAVPLQRAPEGNFEPRGL